jgi:hypothetical protein
MYFQSIWNIMGRWDSKIKINQISQGVRIKRHEKIHDGEMFMGARSYDDNPKTLNFY